MPDWLAHVLFAYILCSFWGTKFKVFDNKGNTALVMAGALIPDLVKVGLGFELLGVHAWDFFAPLHTPVGSFLSASLIALLFSEALVVFSLLVLGFITHFALDLLLGHVSGGMLLLFPVSWQEYQLGLIPADDYWVALILLVLAIIILFVLQNRKGRDR
ncbi:MAG: metal-dependent hydrolase [Candidatus Methanospirareceae archaeon]